MLLKTAAGIFQAADPLESYAYPTQAVIFPFRKSLTQASVNTHKFSQLHAATPAG